MKKLYVNCRRCGVFLKDEEIRESPEFYKNEENVWYCDECIRIRVPENILSDEALKALRKERQAIVRKKYIGDGITHDEAEELARLSKRLALHWRASDPPMPRGYRYPPFWTKCYICEAPMKTEEENHAHWKVCPTRVLDNDIAEQAMGWVLDEEVGLSNRYWCGSSYNYDRGGMSEHTCTNSFEPAKNMEHTNWVMKKLEKEGWEFEIQIRDGRKCAWAYNRKIDRIGASEVEGAELPENICRAILKAIPGSPNR